MTRTTRALPLAVLALVPLLASCGAKVDGAADATAKNATITTCGVKKDIRKPSKPIAYDVSAIEKMFALGLQPSMRGIALPKTVARAAETSPYKADYAKADVIGKDVLSQEQVVGAKADWVFAGWHAGFSEERGITPASLKKLGIDSYIQEETCFNYDDGAVKGKKLAANEHYALDSTYRDLTNLGAIFGVEKKAGDLVASLQKRQKALEARPERAKTPKVFVYDSGTSEPYTAGRRTAPQDIIDLAGGHNIASGLDARWDTMGWESVAKADPDVVVVIDYDKEPLANKLAYLKKQSPIKDSPAVKNDRIWVLDYGKAVSGPTNVDTAEKFAAYLDEKGLT